MRVLVVEDDSKTAKEVSSALNECGFTVDLASSGNQGLEMAMKRNYDAVVLDRMLPEIDGLSILAKLREANILTPVLILSALSSVNEKVEGLRSGGDDYLPKPFEFAELTARVDALTRRSKSGHVSHEICVGDLRLDLINRVVFQGEREIKLLPKEFAILDYIMRNPGIILSRKMIFEAVWGYHYNHDSGALDVHVGKIRKKIESETSITKLVSIRNSGFVLKTCGRSASY